MNIDVARHIIRTAFRTGRELEALLPLLKDHCSVDEYAMYTRAVASAISSIQLELINRAMSAYPELDGEIDMSITKFGRYL